jgi:ribose transport system ATP-binding protein
VITEHAREVNARTGSQDLVLADLRKSYGGVVALDGATLVCSRGELHGVVGENGAGKSTVVRILSGAVAADAGTIALDGTEIAIRSPADAHAAGIATVFQELSLIPHLGVAQNLFYGSEPRSILGRISTRRLARAAGDVFDRFGLPRIDAHKPVYELRLAERQLLEILKALNRQPSVLVLDEPTSALLPTQVEWLFGAARRFADGGGIVLFISHRLSEIEQLCDRVTVLRNGTHVGTGLVQELPEHTLVELMLGRRLERFFPDKAQHERVRDDVVCRLREFAAQPDLHELDLEVRAGQIVGVGGLEGQGQATLFRALFGLRSFTGTFELDGQSTHPRGPSRALARGIALVPEDRASEGLCLPLSVRDNISLSSLSALSRAGLVVRTRERRLVAEARSRLAIKLRSPHQEVASLSGGNQQKVLLARTLATSPSLLLLYDATRGVDVGTKAEIYTLMHALCRDGVGILFYSTDAIELAGMSDRVIVLHDGRVRADLSGEEINEAALVAAAVGGGRKP